MAGENGSSGSDGMGGEGDHALAPADGEILEDTNFSSAPEFDLDPEYVVPQGEDGEGETGGDPWALLGDEGKELAEKKGWRDPADLARAYRELESRLGRQGDSDGQLRALQDKIAKLEGQLDASQARQQQQTGFQPEQDPIESIFSGVDFAQLSEVAGGDPGMALQIYQDQVFLPRLRHILGGMAQELMEATGSQVTERTAPLEQGMSKITLREQAAGLMQNFPDAFPRLRDQVIQRMTSDPRLLNSPDGMKSAFYEVYAEDQATRDRQRRMAGEGEALRGGGGRSPATAPPRNVAKEIKEAIELATVMPRDGL